jgi:tetratricopeptide (TPR) repeat protein
MKDFYISYNIYNETIAEWIAWTLEEAGYSTTIRLWDSKAGRNWVLEMQATTTEAVRTIAVLSPHYLQTGTTQAEWAAAFAQDPTGHLRKLIPVRVEACEVTGLLGQINSVDFVGVPQDQWEELLLRAVSEERSKPAAIPLIPQLGIPANLPRVNALFVGREADIEALHGQLKTTNVMAISSIRGMGGIGKTELALHYAQRHLQANDYPGGVCWLRAREDVGLQILQFAREHFGFVIPDDRSLMAQVAWCWMNWQKARTLVVLDDVQDYGDIEPFLPPQQAQFCVLLTTRRYLSSSVQAYEINVLSEDAALELLRSLVSKEKVDQDLATARQLCEWLGYLPLGLELVGRYVARKKGMSIAKLWERLQEQRLNAKALVEAETGMTATLGVTAAFELSWLELDEGAQRLAALLSLFGQAEIPWELVQQCLPEVDEEELEDLRDEQLVNLSLLSCERTDTYQLHQLLREFFAAKRSQMADDEAMKRSFCGVMVAIAQQIPQVITLEAIERSKPAIPHLAIVATTLNPWVTDEKLSIEPASRIAFFYVGQSAFVDAEKWYAQALEVAEQRFGEDHWTLAAILNNLAELYRLQGYFSQAEPLYIQALEIAQGQPGIEDEDLLTTILNNLAVFYCYKGRYDEAEPLYMRVLETFEQQLGSEHLDVANSLNNLAGLYYSCGRYSEAEPLYWRSLAIREQQLGTEHPDIASSFSNLTLIYKVQGRYSEAEPLLVRSLEIRKRRERSDFCVRVLNVNK